MKLKYQKIMNEYFSVELQTVMSTEHLGVLDHEGLRNLEKEVASMLEDVRWMVNVTENND